MSKTSAPTPLRAVLRALRREILGFQFSYPLTMVPEAGPRESLHYYLYSDALSWDAMRLDSHGIPRTWVRALGTVYFPAYVAWYGLVNLGHYLRTNDPATLAIFLNQVRWLIDRAVLRDDGAIVWQMDFDCQEGATALKAPWISAHPQGLAISALVRAWRLTRDPSILNVLGKATKVFELNVERGGIRVPVNGGVLYAEVPGGPSPGILDGFMTSLLGLYDLWAETRDPAIEGLFRDGVAGLIATLPQWNYRDKWSWYGCHDYLCPPAYHCLNRLLLTVVARLSNEGSLTECANQWDPHRLSPFARAEVFLGCVVTKNVCRVKHRTWRQVAPRPNSASDRSRASSSSAVKAT